MRLVWSQPALEQLEALSQRAPVQAAAVVAAMEWMAGLRQSHLALGRPVPHTLQRYWPVPPQGVFFRVSSDGQELVVVAVRDARRRRLSW
ncbi:MAG: type II toxin-antitoxin system RelE/ParE family toxin [Candidatus Dormibacteria bacterium]